MIQNKLLQLLVSAFDAFTQFFTIIGSDHRYIHEGKGFNGIVQTGSISAAYHIAFTAPATKYMHWRPARITTSANYVEFVLREGDTYTGGTAVTPVNRNRNSTHASTVTTLVKGATSTPAGTILQVGGIGTAGVPTAQSGGGTNADNEIVLKPGTKYVLSLTPAGATNVNLELFWYEEGEG